ncbi:hypothetical protein BU16DRAFT_621858 [Lophium mytilinum]|uniref:Uncharacterized protein n=1 Tax=Lophium mytilinum TaxID=390894 RepID=A0A6A6QD09_9PEZI|nr:hypothetical protein BU16DRAFT_621858 [Lophium mytilinum]
MARAKKTKQTKKGTRQPARGDQAHPTPTNPFQNLPRDTDVPNDNDANAAPTPQAETATKPDANAAPSTHSTSTQNPPQTAKTPRRFIPASDDPDPISFMSDVSAPMPDIATLHINDAEPASFMQSIQCSMPDLPASPTNKARTLIIRRTHPNGALQVTAPVNNRPTTVSRPSNESCHRHYTTEVATRVFGEAPRTPYHENVFSCLDRLVALEAVAVREWRPWGRSLAEIARDLVISLQSTREVDVRVKGRDVRVVDGRIEWAMWAVKAAEAGLVREGEGAWGEVLREVLVGRG